MGVKPIERIALFSVVQGTSSFRSRADQQRTQRQNVAEAFARGCQMQGRLWRCVLLMQDMPQTSLPAASRRHPQAGLTPRPDRIDCRVRAHTPYYIIYIYLYIDCRQRTRTQDYILYIYVCGCVCILITGSTHTNQYYSIYIYTLIIGSAHGRRRRRLCCSVFGRQPPTAGRTRASQVRAHCAWCVLP